MQVPSERELEQFFDGETAGDVQFLETVASWPSLRILDYLFRASHATTGDIARDLNMDMRDVKDRLDALAEHGIVEEDDGEWRATTDQVSVTIERSDGIEVTHTQDERATVTATDSPAPPSTENGTMGGTTERADTDRGATGPAIEEGNGSTDGEADDPTAASADSDTDRSKSMLVRLRELLTKPF